MQLHGLLEGGELVVELPLHSERTVWAHRWAQALAYPSVPLSAQQLASTWGWLLERA